MVTIIGKFLKNFKSIRYRSFPTTIIQIIKIALTHFFLYKILSNNACFS